MINSTKFKQFRLHKYNKDYYRIPEEEADNFFYILYDLSEIEDGRKECIEEEYCEIKENFHNMYDKYIIRI